MSNFESHEFPFAINADISRFERDLETAIRQHAELERRLQSARRPITLRQLLGLSPIRTEDTEEGDGK